MRILIVAVGKMKRSELRPAVDDYLGRIRRYFPCEELELKDAEPRELAERIGKAVPERSRVVALEVEGRALSSRGLADYVAGCERDAVGTLVFLIGGSYGLPPEVSARAHLQLSLSKMTLPHRLARVVVVEQVYRAFSILRGEPYDH